MIDEQIVDDPSASVGEAGVLDIADAELGGVIAGDVLDELERLGPLDPKLTHVRDVKDTYALDHRHVLVDDPRAVLDRHVVACELVHLSP